MRKVGWEGLRLLRNLSVGVLVSVPTVQEPAGHLEMGYKNEHKTQGSSPTLLVDGRACSRARGELRHSPRLSMAGSPSAC